MSRVTRNSKIFSDENNENAVSSRGMMKRRGLSNVPMQPQQPQGKPSYGVNTRKTTRTALGDLSNRIKHPQDAHGMPKKQRVGQPEKPATKKSAFPAGSLSSVPTQMNTQTAMTDDGDQIMTQKDARQAGRSSLAAMVDEVDVAEEDTTLEDSVSTLTLQNVDAADASDPNQVVAYVMDIVNHFKKVETRRMPPSNYMSKQTDINSRMREILIDWLVEVHLKFKLQPETLYLTVNIIDRFLARRAVSRTKLQLVGCTAMLIASKYEEIYAPEVRDFVYISDKAYTREQILAMESIMLNTLSFNLTVPSALRFAQRWAKVAGADDTCKHLINYLLELTLQDSKFLKYPPSYAASAATYLALKMTGKVAWTPSLQAHTKYTVGDIRACTEELYALSAKENPKYKAVRKKYSSSKFNQVAKIPTGGPPSF